MLLLATVYFIDETIRCSSNGQKRIDAIKYSNKLLEVTFNNHPFSLQSEQFDNFNKTWVFTYIGICTVDIIVDKCGVVEIGGLTKGCSYKTG